MTRSIRRTEKFTVVFFCAEDCDFHKLISAELLLRANCENVRDNGVAVGRLQTRAVRHAIYNRGPIFGIVMPKWRQRVALDTAVDQKCSALPQQSDINRSLLC